MGKRGVEPTSIPPPNGTTEPPSAEAASIVAGTYAHLKAVFDASSRVSIIATDLHGTITLFSHGAERLLGYAAAEMVGKATPAMLHATPEMARRAAELTAELDYEVTGFETFVAAAKRGLYEEREWTYLRKDGELVWVNLSVTAVRSVDGSIIGFVGTAVDITERKRIEAQLRASEELFRRLFEDSADALLLIEGGVVIDCNEGTVAMLRGDGKASIVGIRPEELSPPQQPDGRGSAEKAAEMIRLAYAKGSHRFEWEHRRLDGTTFPVEVLLTSIPMGERRVLHTCWRDITDRRQAEAHLREAQKMEVVGQLAGGIAHDFNNMLASILGSADLLALELEQRPELLEYVTTISRAAERAAGLTRNLLAFARRGQESISLVNLHDTLHTVRALLEHTMDRSITIACDLTADDHVVRGDAVQLQNAVMNLAINARDAMPEGGTITLRSVAVALEGTECRLGATTVSEGDYCVVIVEDGGSGIPPSVLAHVFEPFFTTKEVGKGAGLGLASVFGTAKAHGGAVTAESVLGHGSRFSLYLPLLPGAKAATEAVDARGQLRPLTVLVIDDEELVRTSVRHMLRSLGHVVLSAEDAAEGLRVFRERHDQIDVVLLDMIMPHVSGRECFHELRAVDPQARIVLVTGYMRGDEASDLMEQGLVGYLRKPFRRHELAHTLASAVAACGPGVARTSAKT